MALSFRSSSTVQYGINVPFMNLKLCRQFKSSGSSIGKSMPDFINLTIGKFCHWVFHSAPICCAPLLNAIHHIVFLSAQEQMIWIDALRIVALMKNKHSFRNQPLGTLERNPVAHRTPTFFRNLTISRPIKTSHPIPATVTAIFINTYPKTFPKRFSPFFPKCFLRFVHMVWKTPRIFELIRRWFALANHIVRMGFPAHKAST